LIRLLTLRFLAQHIKNWAARLIDCLGGKNVFFFVCLLVCLHSSSVGAVEKLNASFGLNGEVWCLREGKLILLDRCGSCSRKRKKVNGVVCFSEGGGVAWIELNFFILYFQRKIEFVREYTTTGGTHGMWRFCLLPFP
jgi:hypothetical protein